MTNAERRPRIYVEPHFRGVDSGEGGIRRVCEAMIKHLPALGYEITDTMQEADLVHTHAGHTPDVPVGVPWVTSCHGLYWREYEWPKWAEKLNGEVVEAMRRADHVTAPSEWVAQALRRGMLLSPTVLYHGVDPAEWATDANANQGYVLWNKTRLDPICDVSPVNALVRMAPDLPFVSTYGDAAANLQVTGRLPYTVARDVIKGAAVYLCTTRETFGIGTLEALAAGVPVVGWNWGGQREIIRHGETGWLAPVGDVAGLLEGVRWAIANRPAVSEAARADVLERWTWEAAMARYATLYRRLLSEAEERRTSPRVSVVVPCYNLAQYLPDALRSLQAQTATDWEAIVVDDSSPDNTGEIAAAFAAADPRIRYTRNPQNLYLAGALNTGAALATGRYLLNLDADNYLTPGALKIMADALDADRGTAIAYGGVQFVLEDGRTPDRAVGPDGRSGWPVPFQFRHQITGFNDIPSTALLRRSVWERTGGWRRRWRTAEDADFWTRATSYGAVPRKVTEATLLVYRQREDSMSRAHVKPDWPAWYPWSRSQAATPFAVAADPPAKVGLSWPVSSAEPAMVAVIIPVGPGHEQIVIDALDSVDAQTLRNWECVVVNNSGAVLPYVPSWARLLELPRGVGPAAARNAGLAATTAPLVLFLDADDYLQPDCLEVLTAVQKERGGVVYSAWYDDFGDGAAATKVYQPPDYDAALLLKRGCLHAVTALYPRSAVAAVGGFDEGLSHWEDWDLQLALARDGVCGTKVSAPLWTYRKAAGQRREANAAAFDVGKRAILAKWGRFWEGKEELMACRSCPGGGGGGRYAPKAPAAPAPMAMAGGSGMSAPTEDGLVLLEFTGPSAGVVTYRGPATGTAYRFGNIDTARRRYVHPADVAGLLAFKGKFQRADTGLAAGVGVLAMAALSPQLQAPGAPLRTAATAPKTELAAALAVQQFAAEPHPPPTQAEAVAAVQAVADGLTYLEVRAAVPHMNREQVAVMLAKEKASEKPRESVVKLLEAALPHAPETVGTEVQVA